MYILETICLTNRNYKSCNSQTDSSHIRYREDSFQYNLSVRRACFQSFCNIIFVQTLAGKETVLENEKTVTNSNLQQFFICNFSNKV